MSREDKRRILLAAALDYATAVRFRAEDKATDDHVDRAAANLALCALDFAGSTSIYRADVVETDVKARAR